MLIGLMRDELVTVSVDLGRVRRNARAIAVRTGKPIIAVVKADAYGLGAPEVAEAVHELIDAFYVFDSTEAARAGLAKWGRRTIALNSNWRDADDFISQQIHPVVWSIDRATQLNRARPVVSMDTGQQRFACSAGDALEVFRAGDCGEVMTHATQLNQVFELTDALSIWPVQRPFAHAAGSVLLDEPQAWLDAVRPGLAMYEGAMRVTARLVEARDANGPAGYTGFVTPRFGVILAGYSNGIRRGPCMVNGELRQVLEVGMQSAFVELHSNDKAGDEVVLLGTEQGIDLVSVARAWTSSCQEVLVRLSMAAGGRRNYVKAAF